MKRDRGKECLAIVGACDHIVLVNAHIQALWAIIHGDHLARVDNATRVWVVVVTRKLRCVHRVLSTDTKRRGISFHKLLAHKMGQIDLERKEESEM